jgi:hypothetical protein
MRPFSSLVLLVHDNPLVSAGQANTLTRAGYRCLISSDVATALWFAMRYALEPGSPYQHIVLASPVELAARELPDSVSCIPMHSAADDLVTRLEQLHGPHGLPIRRPGIELSLVATRHAVRGTRCS